MLYFLDKKQKQAKIGFALLRKVAKFQNATLFFFT